MTFVPYAARPCAGGLFGGGGGAAQQMQMMQMLAMQQAAAAMSAPQAPPPANPAIAASSEVNPGSAAKNARVAAGLAGSFDNSLLTGSMGAVPQTAGVGAQKNVVGA